VDNKSFSNGNVWGDLTYQKGSRNADGNSGGWSSNLYQLVFGSDFYVADGMRLGGGFALSNTTLTPAYGTGTIQQGSLFAYGKMPIDEYILDAMISIGLNSSDLSRRDITSYTSSGYSQKSNMGGDALASIGISRPFDVQNFRVTPFARVTWQMVTQTGVSETSTSALAINSYSGSGVRGLLGISAGSKSNNPLNEDFTYRAYLAVGADSSGLLNPSMSASLAGLSTTINTPNVGTTFLQVGLYGTAKFSDNAYAYLGLSGETRSGQTLGAINAGLRIQF
jgi:outer membrane autotransporter protein